MDKQLQATNKWCSLSNAIIKKFKERTETNPEEVIRKVEILRRILLSYKWFDESDFENWE